MNEAGPYEQIENLEAEVACKDRLIAHLTTERDHAIRQFGAVRDVKEAVERQRDDWKAKFLKAAGDHCAAIAQRDTNSDALSLAIKHRDLARRETDTARREAENYRVIAVQRGERMDQLTAERNDARQTLERAYERLEGEIATLTQKRDYWRSERDGFSKLWGQANSATERAEEQRDRLREALAALHEEAGKEGLGYSVPMRNARAALTEIPKT